MGAHTSRSRTVGSSRSKKKGGGNAATTGGSTTTPKGSDMQIELPMIPAKRAIKQRGRPKGPRVTPQLPDPENELALDFFFYRRNSDIRGSHAATIRAASALSEAKAVSVVGKIRSGSRRAIELSAATQATITSRRSKNGDIEVVVSGIESPSEFQALLEDSATLFVEMNSSGRKRWFEGPISIGRTIHDEHGGEVLLEVEGKGSIEMLQGPADVDGCFRVGKKKRKERLAASDVAETPFSTAFSEIKGASFPTPASNVEEDLCPNSV